MHKLLATAALLSLALAGCSSPAPDDGLVHIVASTNVYGEIAQAIGGDAVEVTSIIDDPAQDPHSFEGSARVQLALSKADIVVENGGGYDDFVDTMLAGASNPDVVLLNAVDLSGLGTDGAGGEHVWYSFSAMRALADALASSISEAAPDASADVQANVQTFTTGLDELDQRVADIEAAHAGTGVAITEPVPGYLLAAMGLDNVTPPDFSEAVEEGTDVSPVVLRETLALFTDGIAKLLVYNEQTTGPETEDVLTAANDNGVPVVGVTESLPVGETYQSWMAANLDAIEEALG